MNPHSSSYPALATIMHFQITKPDHRRLIYEWAFLFRVKHSSGVRADVRPGKEFGDALLAAFEPRTREIMMHLENNMASAIRQANFI